MASLGNHIRLQKVVFAGLAALSLLHLSAARSEAASDEDQMAQFLTCRFWWADLGTFGKPFGYLYIFDPSPQGGGWYKGMRVKFQGFSTYTDVLGFAWKPTATSVIIDHAYSTQEVGFVGWYSYEVFRVTGDAATYWVSTRSPYAPYTIRTYWWK